MPLHPSEKTIDTIHMSIEKEIEVVEEYLSQPALIKLFRKYVALTKWERVVLREEREMVANPYHAYENTLVALLKDNCINIWQCEERRDSQGSSLYVTNREKNKQSVTERGNHRDSDKILERGKEHLLYKKEKIFALEGILKDAIIHARLAHAKQSLLELFTWKFFQKKTVAL